LFLWTHKTLRLLLTLLYFFLLQLLLFGPHLPAGLHHRLLYLLILFLDILSLQLVFLLLTTILLIFVFIFTHHILHQLIILQHLQPILEQLWKHLHFELLLLIFFPELIRLVLTFGQLQHLAVLLVLYLC
jgi:hypothetical protein